MKAASGLLILSLTFADVALAKVNVLICSIGQSYTFKVYEGQNIVDLWEMASSMGRPIGEDTIIKKEEGPGTLMITLKNTGVIKLDFNNIYKEGRGTWSHNGTLDAKLADEPYYNSNGVAEVESCYTETYR